MRMIGQLHNKTYHGIKGELEIFSEAAFVFKKIQKRYSGICGSNNATHL